MNLVQSICQDAHIILTKYLITVIDEIKCENSFEPLFNVPNT